MAQLSATDLSRDVSEINDKFVNPEGAAFTYNFNDHAICVKISKCVKVPEGRGCDR